MTQDFEIRRIISRPPPVEEIFAVHQLALDFQREVEYRQQRDRDCEWYRRVARQHQEELAHMRGDINLFRWFLRR